VYSTSSWRTSTSVFTRRSQASHKVYRAHRAHRAHSMASGDTRLRFGRIQPGLHLQRIDIYIDSAFAPPWREDADRQIDEITDSSNKSASGVYKGASGVYKSASGVYKSAKSKDTGRTKEGQEMSI